LHRDLVLAILYDYFQTTVNHVAGPKVRARSDISSLQRVKAARPPSARRSVRRRCAFR
jgi:hypothetical protein